ncbi:HEAT repeat protein [Sulfuritortus calidifontis]|uniref:HEAT repeat protein n=1 Tax=Sulfuritortus calidifontis TaxID=1914471 RepID=A0A4R3JUJ5_9PROT|nr:HEAT repeat domain-containing protein [Sulfuritortus calidifontis]TCS71499.1 HEAT repeat protein [Sulfuritortus calidifontis]
MGSVAHSDLLLKLALWGGSAAMLLTILLVVQIMLTRLHLILSQRREQQFSEIWRPIMAQALFTLPDRPPAVPFASVRQFLHLWIHIMELLRGEGTRNLTDLALACGIDQAARKLTRKSSVTDRVLGLLALAHMAQEQDWELMLEQLTDENPLLSQIAARGLTHIRPQEAIPLILPQLVRRRDWAPIRIANILEEAGPDLVTAPFIEFAMRLPSEQIPHILPFLYTVYETELEPLLYYWLETEHNPQTLIGCLKAVQDPLAVPAVRSLTSYPDWVVRVQAAAALGRIGMKEDKAVLTGMLSDREWWVRYRAAQALLGLPGMDIAALRRLQATLTDHFARDILEHVIAEQGAT